ncbi:MAG: hypothetical protein R2825_18045 [Saprospiraceae bacterium]
MLICNNCGSSNQTTSQQCGHCNMTGDFTPHEISKIIGKNKATI